jgi:phosphate transport system protein
MLRTTLDRELREIQDDVLLLGSMTEKAIERAMDALSRRDLLLVRQVIVEDKDVNARRFAIEEACILVMATQQPVAADLRVIVAVLNVISDIERMADHAAGIARIVLLLEGEMPQPDLGYIPEMAVKARGMLHDSLTALVERDVNAATLVSSRDDEVDSLYDTVYAVIFNKMVRDPAAIVPLTYHLWIAHNLERIADRTTNIAERVVFLVTGRMDELNVSHY